MRAVTVTMFAFFFGFGFGAAVAQVSQYGQEIYQQGRPTTYSTPARPASPYGQEIPTQTYNTTPSRPAWADSGNTRSSDYDSRRDTRHQPTELDRRYGYGR
jgi:hypothetical protein